MQVNSGFLILFSGIVFLIILVLTLAFGHIRIASAAEPELVTWDSQGLNWAYIPCPINRTRRAEIARHSGPEVAALAVRADRTGQKHFTADTAISIITQNGIKYITLTTIIDPKAVGTAEFTGFIEEKGGKK